MQVHVNLFKKKKSEQKTGNEIVKQVSPYQWNMFVGSFKSPI